MTVYKFLMIRYNSNFDVCLGGKNYVILSHIRKVSEKNIGCYQDDYEFQVQMISEIGFILTMRDQQRKEPLYLKLILRFTKDYGSPLKNTLKSLIS